MKSKEKALSFGLVFAGLLFFFNPFFAAVDVLPDFIGCILLYFGLYKPSRLYRPLAQTQKRFLKLAAVDLVKDIALLFVFVDGTDAELPTALLVVAFGAAVAELYFLLPAVYSLFEGITALAMQEDCAPFYRALIGNRSRGEWLARASVAFLSLREVLCLLPEFSALFTSSYSDSGVMDLYNYIGVMRAIGAGVVLLAGVVWICLLARYFAGLHREIAFRTALAEKYRAYVSHHPGDAVQMRHFVAFLSLAIGAFLTADFYLDYQNVIPDIAAAGFLLLGICVLEVPRRRKGIAAMLAVAFGGVSFWSSRLAYRFASEYRASDIARNEDVAGAYRTLWLSALLEFLLFLALVAVILLCLRKTVAKYAGYRPEHADTAFEKRRLEALKNEFDSAFIKVMLFALLSGLFSFLYDYIKEIPASGFFRILEFWWFFDMVLSLVFATVLSSTLYALYEQIQKKYAFDGISAEHS